MNALEKLKSALCDHMGAVVISGSDEDRMIVAQALDELSALQRALVEYPDKNTHQLQARKVCAGVIALAESYGGSDAATGIDLAALRDIVSDLSHSAKVDDYEPQQVAFIDSIRDRLSEVIDASHKGGHCTTCQCDPNMTPAMRFDLSPAAREGEIRSHLIALGWTPPDSPKGGSDAWRPMDAAPKSVADGKRVEGIYLLGFIPDADLVDPQACIDVIWWEPLLQNSKGGRGKWCANRYGEACEVEPTGWQHLPSAPATSAEVSRD